MLRKIFKKKNETQKIHRDIDKVLITEEQIRAKVKELAEQISSDYRDKELLLLVILKGATTFLADLSRLIDIPVTIDFIVASRYAHTDKSEGQVTILKDLEQLIAQKDVLIVEDVIDNGNTLHYIYNHLKLRNPNSLKICAFFDKPEKRILPIKPDYKGFTLSDQFVVGYGLDYKQKYRQLPYVGILKRKICK